MFCCSTHNLFSPSVQSYFFLTPWKGKILVLWASNFSGAQFMKLMLNFTSECGIFAILLTFL